MTKTCLVITIVLILFSCTQKLDKPKYKIGDVVYLKPDSTKALIINDDVFLGEYEIEYSINKWVRHYCQESDIYGVE